MHRFCIYLSLCATLTMMGCAYSTNKLPDNPIPANLDSSCPSLERLTGVTGKEILPWATLTVRMYYDCQAKVDGLRAAWPNANKAN